MSGVSVAADHELSSTVRTCNACSSGRGIKGGWVSLYRADATVSSSTLGFMMEFSYRDYTQAAGDAWAYRWNAALHVCQLPAAAGSLSLLRDLCMLFALGWSAQGWHASQCVIKRHCWSLKCERCI